jgi:hypothetical protein
MGGDEYNKDSAKCHPFEKVIDIFLSDADHIYILAYPFVFVRYSIASEKVKEFEVLDNEAQKNKVANAYKTTFSKGQIYMSFR